MFSRFVDRKIDELQYFDKVKENCELQSLTLFLTIFGREMCQMLSLSQSDINAPRYTKLKFVLKEALIPTFKPS